MNNLHIDQEWLRRLLPEGPRPDTSALITGPGDSGKPQVGNVIAGSWRRQGGKEYVGAESLLYLATYGNALLYQMKTTLLRERR